MGFQGHGPPKTKNKLNLRQRSFVEAYLVHKNAARAAREAGYSVHSARAIGCELLTNTNIRNAIEVGVTEDLAQLKMNREEVLLQIKRYAFNGKRDLVGIRALELLGQHFGVFDGKDGADQRDRGPNLERIKSAIKRVKPE